MISISRNFTPFLGRLFFAVLLITAWFWPVVQDPGSYLFAWAGEGLTNYFLPGYYLLHDAGDAHLEQMLYPYGSHILYGDSQPLLSKILHLIHNYIVDISGQWTAIMNLLMVYSSVPAFLLVQRILSRLDLPNWYTWFWSIIITLMAPQVIRMAAGHYALSYSCFFPLIWWLLIKWTEQRFTLRWAVAVCLAILSFSLLHLYFLVLGGSFILAWLFIKKLSSDGLPLHALIKGLAIVLLPIIVIQVWLMVTDTGTDLHPNPWGFFHTYATWQSIFIPQHSGLHDWFANHFNLPTVWGEGIAYVGLLGVLSILALLVYLVKFRFSTRPFPTIFRSTIWVGLLFLLLSMLPHIWPGVDSLREFIPQLQQFRSLGRFAWGFFYVWLVFTAWWSFKLYTWLKRSSYAGLAYGWLMLFLGVYAWEGYANAKYVHYNVTAQQNRVYHHFLYDHGVSIVEQLEAKSIKWQDYQAILPVPAFLHGSEKIYHNPSFRASFAAYSLSLETGLPIVSGLMSRASITNTLALATLTAHPWIPRIALDDFPNQRPFLMIYDSTLFPESNHHLVQAGSLLCEFGDWFVYHLPFDALYDKQQEGIDTYLQDSTLLKYDDYASTGKVPPIIVSYEIEEKAPTFMGNGTISQIEEQELTLFIGPLPADTGCYEASVWIHLDRQQNGMPELKYRQLDKTFKIVDEKTTQSKTMLDVWNNWLRVPLTFKLMSPDNIVQLYLDGTHKTGAELLIRPINDTIYQNEGNWLRVNNYFLNKESLTYH